MEEHDVPVTVRQDLKSLPPGADIELTVAEARADGITYEDFPDHNEATVIVYGHCREYLFSRGTRTPLEGYVSYFLYAPDWWECGIDPEAYVDALKERIRQRERDQGDVYLHPHSDKCGIDECHYVIRPKSPKLADAVEEVEEIDGQVHEGLDVVAARPRAS